MNEFVLVVFQAGGYSDRQYLSDHHAIIYILGQEKWDCPFPKPPCLPLGAPIVPAIGFKSVLKCGVERFWVVLPGNNFPFKTNNTGKRSLAEHSAHLTKPPCCLLIKYKNLSVFKPCYAPWSGAQWRSSHTFCLNQELILLQTNLYLKTHLTIYVYTAQICKCIYKLQIYRYIDI